MTSLEEIIKSKAPLSIAEFMRLALNHEDYGYYKAQKPIGLKGDFTTAPEISQFFGEMLGLWAVIVWEQLGKPSHFKWVEFGPGRGTLLKDAFRITKTIRGFHEALRFSFVEINPYFKELQREIAPHAKWHSSWQDCLRELTQDSIPFVLIANEFLDALPIHQYDYKENQWFEKFVSFDDGWKYVEHPLEDSTIPETTRTKSRENNSNTFEICPEAQTLIQTLSQILKIQQGAALFIDYGYAQGHGDSFQAIYKGQPVSPLTHIGEADLTAHVDFGNLKEVSGTPYGPIPQGEFLNNLGLFQWKEKLKAQSTLDKKALLEAQYQRLTHPQQMGQLFKVMGLAHPSLQLVGFS